MKPIYYLLIFDAIIIIIMIRIIFGGYKIFLKSLGHHFFPDDDFLPNPLDAFAEKNDSRHKINLFYAVILALGVITALPFILPVLRNR
jgi:hypothetical protein